MRLPAGFGGAGGPGGGRRLRRRTSAGAAGVAGGFGGGGRRRGRIRGGAAGGLLNGSTPGKQLTALLSADASRYSWVAAATGSNTASGYQLATGDPVMAIGGFNGTDPAPTLAQFEKYVAEGRIHYYIGGGGASEAGASATRALGLLADRVVGEATSPPRPSTA